MWMGGGIKYVDREGLRDIPGATHGVDRGKVVNEDGGGVVEKD